MHIAPDEFQVAFVYNTGYTASTHTTNGSLQSCAHWLNFKVGLNLGAAREKVRVAHALAGVPKSTPPPMPRATFRGNVVLERKVLIGSCRPSPSAAIRTVLSRSASLRSE